VAAATEAAVAAQAAAIVAAALDDKALRHKRHNFDAYFS
jgi:hypothetical protein